MSVRESITRRGLLIGASSLGITMAFARTRSDSTPQDRSTAIATGDFEPTIWFDIDRDGIVTVNIIRAELGQHVGTALARIVADELEARWEDVRLRYVDSDPRWGVMVTGGSWSVWQSFPYLSQAGAAGRIAMIDAGSRLLRVSAANCVASASAVHCGARSITFAQIVQRGAPSRVFTAAELKALPLKAAAQRRLIAKPVAALDIPAKVDGSARYGLDASIAGMVYARPKLPPTRNDSKVVSIDDSAARRIPGYLKSLALADPSGTVPGWVVVYGETFFAANRAADLVKVSWSVGESGKVSEAQILDEGRRLISEARGGVSVVESGDVDAAFANASDVIEQTYTTSTALHFQMEPLNALAFVKDDVWEIHTGNQWQSLILPQLATALGVPQDKVVMRTYLLGGGFGRRLNGDYAIPAALAAQALGRPVKLVFTREDDVRFDSPRSASVQKLRMALAKDGAVLGMEHHAAAGWPTEVMFPSFMPKGLDGRPYDPFSISGADHFYAVGAHRVRALSNKLANRTFRPGWLRSVGPGWTNWALESFMDEAAHAARIDVIAFRLRMLAATPRQAAVLRRAAQLADWGARQQPGVGQGIATTFGQERDMPTWCACVAQVQVERSSGVARLLKLTLVVDAGTLVHPDGALAQVEGAALWGASLALHEGTELVNGQVADTNLHRYTPLRMRDTPQVVIEFIQNAELPMGLGEPATTVVGPAIGNAIFAAVGVRMRHLPIRPAALRAAMLAHDRGEG